MKHTKPGFYAIWLASLIMFITPAVYFLADEWGISGEIVPTDMYSGEHILFATALGDFFINPPKGVELALGPLTVDSSYVLHPNPGMTCMLIIFFVLGTVGTITCWYILKDSKTYSRDAYFIGRLDLDLYEKYPFLRGFDLIPYFESEKRKVIFDGNKFYSENCK